MSANISPPARFNHHDSLAIETKPNLQLITGVTSEAQQRSPPSATNEGDHDGKQSKHDKTKSKLHISQSSTTYLTAPALLTVDNPRPPEPSPTDTRGRLSFLFKGHQSEYTVAFSEIRKSVAADPTSAINQFQALNNDISLLCNDVAASLGRGKEFPASDDSESPDSKRQVHMVLQCSPTDFKSVEDYCFFSLLSILNSSLSDNIFKPSAHVDEPRPSSECHLASSAYIRFLIVGACVSRPERRTYASPR